LKISSFTKQIKSNQIRPIAGQKFGYSVYAPFGRIDASPHTNYLPIF